MLFEGVAGRFIQRAVGNLAARLTGNQSVPVAQVEGEGDEMTRAGLRFHLCSSGATGIASATTVATTTAAWVIYNPAGSPVTAFFDQLGVEASSGTIGAGATLYAAILGPTNTPT